MAEESTRERLRATLLARQKEASKITGEEPVELKDSILSKLTRSDESVDYKTGLQDAGFRADFSKMDTSEEKVSFLNNTLGSEGWKEDSFGELLITPDGLDALGVPNNGIPVAIDERGASMFDIADLRGAAPGIAGAVAAGVLTGGVGFFPALAAVGGGAALGKGLGELEEQLSGENLQSFGEVAADVATEGAVAAAGEGVFRGLLRPLGKKLLAPEVKRMTPARIKLLEEASEAGLTPTIRQASAPPILGRFESIAHVVFGDPLVKQNAAVMEKAVAGLAARAGPPLGKKGAGELVAKDIKFARKALSRWAKAAYGKVDDLTGGESIIPTARLKTQAKDILDSFPKSEEGRTLFTTQIEKYFDDISQLPEKITTKQMQSIRSQIFDAVDDKTLVPGMQSRHASMLGRSATNSFDDAVGNEEAVALLKAVNSRYGKEITKFDDAFVKRLTLDPKFAGRVEPEDIVASIFKKGKESRMARVMELMKPSTKAAVRRNAMEDVLGTISRKSEVPGELIYSGKNLTNALDSYGDDTLNAMFGKEVTADLRKFADVSQFVTQQTKISGGLVAAAIAISPILHLGALVKLKFLAKLMTSKQGLKWLTTGYAEPTSAAGIAAAKSLGAFTRAFIQAEGQGQDRNQFMIGEQGNGN